MRIRKSAEDRKVEIVQAALTLAFEVGPERVTTGMIAGHLSLTQPAIYKHFPSKDDIWGTVATYLSSQIAENIMFATTLAENPIERLRMLVLGHLRLVHKTPALPQIMVTRDPNDVQNAVRNEVRSSMTTLFGELVRAIEDAQSGGYLRTSLDAKDLAALVFGIIQSLVLRMLVMGDTSILLVDGERLLDLQLSAFTRMGDTE